jgi:protein subunit release factor B
MHERRSRVHVRPQDLDRDRWRSGGVVGQQIGHVESKVPAGEERAKS